MPKFTAAHARLLTLIVLTAISPFMFYLSLQGHLERALPEPRHTLFIVLDVVLGVLALVMLPKVLYRDSGAPDFAVDERREKRALWWGIAVILCAALSGMAALTSMAALVSLAGRRRPDTLLKATLAGGLVAGYRWGAAMADDTSHWQIGAVGLLLLVALILLGLYLGGRRDLVAALRREASSMRASREAREAEARQEERTRIAREMHDSVSHRLALVALHAGALEFRADLSPGELREAVGVIRQGVSDAQEELRATLNVLRSDGADAHPAATIAEVEALAERVRAAGVRVDVTLDLPPERGVPEATSAHLHRVVQESLTNAVKHAPGQPITIVIEGDAADGVRVEVRNPVSGFGSPGDGSRVGLVGLRERLDLVGGTFGAGPEKGEFVVRAWVPWKH